MLLRISFFQQHQRKCRYVASSLLGYGPLGFRRYAPSIVDAENSSMISRARVHAGARGATIAAQQRQALLADLERHFNPPPPPEPEVVYVEAVEGLDQLGTSDFNPKLWMQKPRSWF